MDNEKQKSALKNDKTNKVNNETGSECVEKLSKEKDGSEENVSSRAKYTDVSPNNYILLFI